MKTVTISVTLLLAFVLFPLSALAAGEAETTYKSMCASCHGNTGDGNGPAGTAMKPKPRDFTDVEWQKNTTDDQIAKAISKGGPGIGKSLMMPPFSHISGEKLNALVAFIRTFSVSE